MYQDRRSISGPDFFVRGAGTAAGVSGAGTSVPKRDSSGFDLPRPLMSGGDTGLRAVTPGPPSRARGTTRRPPESGAYSSTVCPSRQALRTSARSPTTARTGGRPRARNASRTEVTIAPLRPSYRLTIRPSMSTSTRIAAHSDSICISSRRSALIEESSACTGIRTPPRRPARLRAAYRALSVMTPRDGGQSIRQTSKSSSKASMTRSSCCSRARCW